MKIAFVQYPWWDLIGVMSLSAVLKNAGHKCEVFIGEKNLIKSLNKFSPDIIGFSAVTGPHIWDLEVANKLKKEFKVPIIFGGPHPTFFPKIIEKDCVDIVCRGEGEYAMLELANKLEEGKKITNIKNLWVKKNGRIFKNDLRPLIKNLDELPFPDREVYYEKYHFLKDFPLKVFLTGRGCPYQCTFCFNASLRKLYSCRGTYVRRSVDNVIEEIKQVKKRYRIQTLAFTDDTFILNPKWLEEFFKKYPEEIGIPYICHIRADLFNEKIAQGLKNSNCICTCMGLESGNEYFRNSVLKKGTTNDQIIGAAKLLKKHGIKMSTYNILGLPGETLENAFETVELNIRIKPDWLWCSIFQPYPSTELGEYVKKHRYVGNLDVDHMNPIYFDKSVLNQKNINEMVNLQKLFYLVVKFPSLMPLVKSLIKLPPNKLFTTIFKLGYVHRWVTMNRLGVKAVIDRIRYPILNW